ncbi:hypothetical protein MKEN_00729900 [Mycena kentingensis (nom. inval.)]|nr:hypothetical protein MKEN_00729900 [Mycena kentingensis (nom. inval.)]
MLQWEQFSACLCIGGSPLPVYSAQNQVSKDGKTPIVSCWVVSQVGKQFSVIWRNTSTNYPHDTCGLIRMDGTSCGGKFMLNQFLPGTTEIEGVCGKSGSEAGGAGPIRTMQPFVFAKVAVSDDEALLECAASCHNELGTIELTIVPITRYFLSTIGTPSLVPIKVHERSKGAVQVGQQVTLGKPRPMTREVDTYKADRSGPDIVKFVFRYRPLEILQAKGIVPLPILISPSPSAVSSGPRAAATLRRVKRSPLPTPAPSPTSHSGSPDSEFRVSSRTENVEELLEEEEVEAQVVHRQPQDGEKTSVLIDRVNALEALVAKLSAQRQNTDMDTNERQIRGRDGAKTRGVETRAKEEKQMQMQMQTQNQKRKHNATPPTGIEDNTNPAKRARVKKEGDSCWDKTFTQNGSSMVRAKTEPKVEVIDLTIEYK